jgi:hypothetical protein
MGYFRLASDAEYYPASIFEAIVFLIIIILFPRKNTHFGAVFIRCGDFIDSRKFNLPIF